MEADLTNKRVITGVGPDGKSRLLSVAPVVATLFGDEGEPSERPAVSELWVMDQVPPSVVSKADPRWDYALEPPPGGLVFRLARIPPDTQVAAEEQPTLRFGMHRTESVDCLVVLSGRIRLLMEDGQVELGPGDFAVQQATKHAWWNPGPDSCLMCAILVSTKPAKAGE